MNKKARIAELERKVAILWDMLHPAQTNVLNPSIQLANTFEDGRSREEIISEKPIHGMACPVCGETEIALWGRKCYDNCPMPCAGKAAKVKGGPIVSGTYWGGPFTDARIDE